ncbi:hypothetical protein SCE1572_03900 [Sorangium cellulosum So0157-2]|uniref:Uncharacterized protein n=2 Tax=Sorangium cellulosum TaxID=56 RepID=S4XKK3_SORCE|nr:hypothetical protein SCE1572_03900 [Sorangium cellulosum So0157-2]
MAAEILKLDIDEVNLRQPVVDYGLNSVLATEFIERFERRFGIRLAPTVFFEYQDLHSLANHLVERYPDRIERALDTDRSTPKPAPPRGTGTANGAAASDASALGRTRHAQPSASGAGAPMSDLEALWGGEGQETTPGELASADAPTPDAGERAPAGAAPSQRGEHAPVGAAPSQRDDVAVIGLCAVLPASADIEAFWAHLLAGDTLITRIPAERITAGTYHPAPIGGGRRSDVAWGAFLDGVDAFDAAFFGITPREAELMDPQQRLFLQTVWHVIEDAGYDPRGLANSRTGVFVGVATTDYLDLAMEAGVAPDAYMATGLAHSILANRVSFLLGLSGPSEPVNTACSSSLVAIHRAVESIRAGECDMAIAGGVNLILHSRVSDAFQRAGMLSPTGRCNAFAAGADGFVRGEGVGAVLLKPLRKARADGDPIRGVIRGSAINHNGRSGTLIAPRLDAQVDVLLRAYMNAGVDPSTVGLIEAYGIGADLADQVEILALKRAFDELYQRWGLPAPKRPHCAIGSVKTNVGSLETASGMASLAKVLLAMKHAQLPRNANASASAINPHIDLSGSPFYLLDRTTAWPSSVDPRAERAPRRAGISAFGYGGVNAHVVVEEPDAPEAMVNAEAGPRILVLSARTEERLRVYASRLARSLRRDIETGSAPALRDLAFTLQVSRASWECRAAAVVRDLASALDALDAIASGEARTAGVLLGEVPKRTVKSAVTDPSSAEQEEHAALVADRQWKALARRWVEGESVAWTRLYADEPAPRRVSLPGYPFDGRRHWLFERGEAGRLKPKDEGARVGEGAIQDAHRGDASASGGAAQVDESRELLRTVYRAEDTARRGHTVRGVGVVPASTLIERTFAAASALSAARCALERIVFLRPVSCARGEVSVRVVAAQRERGWEFEIQDDPGAVYARGVIALGEGGPMPQPLPLDEIEQRCADELSATQLYRALSDAGIEYSLDLRALTRVGRGPGEALGRYRVDRASPAPEALLGAVFEGAIQTLAAVLSTTSSRMVFSLGRVEVWRGPGRSGWTYAQRTSDERFDVIVTDDVGAICIRLLDVALRAPAVSAREEAADGAEPLAAPSSLQAALSPARSRLGAVDAAAHVGALAKLESFAQRLLLHALRGAGIDPSREGVDRDAIRRALGVTPARERLLSALLNAVRTANAPAAEHAWDPALEAERLAAESPSIAAHLAFLTRCAAHLVAVLRGEVTPTEVVFPGGSSHLVEAVYGDSPLTVPFNEAVATAVRTFVAQRASAESPDRRVRIIEVGAGTGGTSVPVLEAIEPWRRSVEYVYTDISRGLLRRAEERIGATRSFVRFAVLDIEQDIEQQGFQAGRFDVVIAANVLHATRDIEQAVGHARDLLGPGGWLVVSEATSPQLFLTMTFGLLDGWWRSEDDRRSPDGPLLGLGGWQELFRDLGFSAVSALTAPAPGGAEPHQAVLIAESDGRIARPSAPRPAEARQPHAAARAGRQAVGPRARGPEAAEPIVRELVAQICAALRMKPDDVDVHQPFADYGVDSIIAVELVERVNRILGTKVFPTALFEHNNILALAARLAEELADAPHTGAVGAGAGAVAPADVGGPGVASDTAIATQAGGNAARATGAKAPDGLIAVIGMSGRFPGARNLAEFWRLLASGTCAIRKAPKERWAAEEIFDPDPDRLDRSYCVEGGFLDDVDLFDAAFFGISGREAELTDPQHRLFLEEAYAALEDAGYATESIRGARCSVFVGAGAGDYLNRMLELRLPKGAQAFWGNTASVLASRLSYFLDMKGVSLAVDTACSSSLVAVHLACQSLLDGESDLAIAGGAFLNVTPNFHILASNARMLSPVGRCKAFSADADGFVPGEGVGAVVLKRLDAALRDGDCIHGVILGSAVNQDGRTNGIIAPSVESQAALLRDVYDRNGIDPATITYVEAHGTGTRLGDPIEVEGLTRAFRQSTDAQGYCALGSVKTNIGHAATAAGIAGLLKGLLCLRHGQIPPSLHFSAPNPAIDFGASPFFVNTELREWSRDRRPRRMTVSSFGFGGTNAHLVLAEPPERPLRPAARKPAAYVVPLSAKHPDALCRRISDLGRWLKGQALLHDLRDVVHTLQRRRSHHAHRAAFVVRDAQELLEAIRAVEQEGRHPRALTSEGRGSVTGLRRSLDELAASLCRELGDGALPPDEQDKKSVALAELYVVGTDIDWERAYPDEGRAVSLPTYPFVRQRFWAEPPAEALPRAAEAPRPRPPATDDGRRVAYFGPRWDRAPLQIATARAWQGGDLVVFDLDAQLVREQRARGLDGARRILWVRPGARFDISAPDAIAVDPSSPDDYRQLWAHLAGPGSAPAALVLLWPWRLSARAGADAGDVERALAHGIRAIELLARAMCGAPPAAETRLVLVHRGDLEVRAGDQPLGEAAAAYGRSLRPLLPQVRFLSLMLPGDLDERRLADLLDRELSDAGGDPHREVAYDGGERYVRGLGPAEPIPSEDGAALRERGHYLITGGAGGLGRIFARHLARRCQARLLLLGRSPLDERLRAELTSLEELGAEIMYHQADVTRARDLEGALAEAKRRFGPLHGVIHAAGVITGRLLTDKSHAEFEATLRPKIAGTPAIDAVTAGEPLDFFVAFSSASSWLGDMGQGDYAVANRFMDAYCLHREGLRRRGLRRGRSVSIAWPLWRDGGMRFAPDLEQRYLRSSGLTLVEERHGIEAFEAILAGGPVQVMPLVGDLSLLAPILGLSAPRAKPSFNAAAVDGVAREAPAGGRGGAAGPAREQIEADLRKSIAAHFKVNIGELELDDHLGALGFDSLMLTELADRMSRRYGVEVLPTVFFSHNTVRSLAAHLVEAFGPGLRLEESPPQAARGAEVSASPLEAPLAAAGEAPVGREAPAVREAPSGAPGSEPSAIGRARQGSDIDGNAIAIVGMSGVFPGARDLDELWEHLVAERDLITEVPPERWDWRAHFGAERGQSTSRWGGFIADVDRFDAAFFRISPLEAKLMDPQQRLFLEHAWKAIESSGHRASELAGRAVGVFAGVQFNDYQMLLSSRADYRAQVITGNAHTMVANRVSYALDLHGPSEAIDTACSASLVALNRAVRALRAGECEAALVGGVSLMLAPSTMIGASQLEVLSPRGRCRTLDAGADGFVKGEGVGVLFLKPLSAALADGDPIHAILRGAAVNHGGRAHSLTAPNADAQAALLQAAYKDAGVAPETVTYIELHGTGTKLGDPVEVEGLKKAFGRTSAAGAGPTCGLGSVKANIGHLEPAAGIAGVIKVVLSMRHGVLPGNPHLVELNPYLQIEGTPFYAVERMRPWQRLADPGGSPVPRRAGVSSFGFGGANAHVVLEEHVQTPAASASGRAGPELILLSAREEERLRDAVAALAAYLERRRARGGEALPSLRDIAFTLALGREELEWRLALAAGTHEELIEKLRAALGADPSCPGVHRGHVSRRTLPAESDGAAALHALAERDLDTLARLWTGGARIALPALFEGEPRPRRVSIPTYPFRGPRYWFDTSSSVDRGRSDGDGKPELAPAADPTFAEVWERRARSYQGDEVTLKVVDGSIAWIEMNDVTHRNMFSEGLVLGLLARFREIQGRADIKAVVLAGGGNVFMMGGTEDGLIDIADGNAKYSDLPFLYEGLLRCEVPVIAAMQGHALGAGLCFGLYADVVVMAEEAIYGANFMSYGFTPGLGATYILAERFGNPLATEMMYVARSFTGRELKERRSSPIFRPAAEVHAEALAIARRLADKPRESLVILKQELAGRTLAALPRVIAAEIEMHRQTFAIPEVRERIREHFAKASLQPIAAAGQPAAPEVSASAAAAAAPALSTAAPPASVAADAITAILRRLRSVLSDALQIEDEVDAELPFQEMGVDSISGVEIIRDINRTFGLNLEAIALYDHPTLNALAERVRAELVKAGRPLLGELSGQEAAAPPASHAAASSEQATPAEPARSAVALPPSALATPAAPTAAAAAGVAEIDVEHAGTTVAKAVSSERASAERAASIDGGATVTTAADVAIIGMAGRFPGAPDRDRFWHNLAHGVDSVTEVPPERFDVARVFDPDPRAAGRTYCKWGGFLTDIDRFDAEFFHVSPKEAEMMAPEQRLFLEESWRALEDAGYSDRRLAGSRCGVFVGASARDYVERARGRKTAHALTGLSNSVLAARIAYHLDLKGPAIAVDTACSSSLVAIWLACQSLLAGECTMAIAGGVTLMLSPDFLIVSSNASVLSPTGKCATFSSAADGIVMSEGVGVVVLKPLARALADRDHIHAVIKAVGANQDGKTNGISAPSARSQTVLELDVYRRAGIDPDQISYVEAHGTGTPLGDPIELKALKDAFSAYSAERARCPIGSVKTNIGHANMAAGVASVIKVALAMRNRQIPPSLHFGEPNPHIDFGSSPFYVNTALTPWERRSDGPRLAALSSFGFSGTNAHAVLAEPPAPERHGARSRPHLVVLSAKSEAALRRRLEDLFGWLGRQGDDLWLGDVSFTLGAGRSHFELRSAFVVRDPGELRASLEAALAGKAQPHARRGDVPSDHAKVREARARGARAQDACARAEGSEDRRRQALLEMAEAYVGGYDPDWEAIFADEDALRIPLPTYPFQGERYWIDDEEQRSSAPAAHAASHPLIDGADWRGSLGEGLVFRKTFSPDDPVVRDHRVQGQAILPAVAYLELVLAALAAAGAEAAWALRRVRWLRPLAVGDLVEVQVRLRDDKGQIRFEVTSGKSEERHVHAQGDLCAADPAPPRSVDLDGIRRRCARRLAHDEIYAQYAALGIVYQGDYQALAEVSGNRREALGVLRLPAEAEGRERYRLDPALADAALQAISGFVLDAQEGQALLPFSAEEVEVYRPVGAGGFSYLELAGERRFHVTLLDLEGNVCAVLRDISLRPWRDPLADFFYTPRWVEQPHAEALPQQRAAMRSVLVIHADERLGLKESVAALHPGAVIAEVVVGARHRRRAPDSVEIPAEDPKGYTAALEDLLTRVGSIDCIYFLASLLPPGRSAGDLREVQERSVIALFRLIKGLIDAGLQREPLRLAVATNDVHPVTGKEALDARAAGVHGLTKAISKELSGWDVSCVDVSLEGVRPAAGPDPWGALLAELSREPRQRGGEDVAVRDGRRFVRAIEKVTLAPRPEAPLRRGGVYLILGGAKGIGLALSRDLAARFSARLVWIGRSPLDAERRRDMDEIRRAGGEVLYLQADATDRRAMDEAIQRARQRFGRIDGAVHSAIVLEDRSLLRMTEGELRAVLGPKVDGAVNLVEALAGDALDFLVFFSSAQSFAGSAGQGNYAAASTFEDAFAHAVARRAPFPVRIINWGYWGTVGIVANAEVATRMSAMGIGSIRPEEGAEAFRRILAHDLVQVMAIRADKRVGERLDLLQSDGSEGRDGGRGPAAPPSWVDRVVERTVLPAIDAGVVQRYEAAATAIERLTARMLWQTLVQAGALPPGPAHLRRDELRERLRVLEGYRRLFDASLDVLARAGYLRLAGDAVEVLRAPDGAEPRLEEARVRILEEHPEARAAVSLLDVCVDAFPAVVSGEKDHMAVLFPGGGMSRVEGIYRGNAVIDYFNRVTASAVEAYVRARLADDPSGTVRILEVGAGTGGTTAFVLEALKPHAAAVRYLYTDVSRGFAEFGRSRFAAAYPFVEFEVVDAERASLTPVVQPGTVDVVLASNAIHATRRIGRTLGEIRALLRPGGLLVLNEGCRRRDFATLTFGLTSGWWLYEDERLPWAPLLSVAGWERVLRESGFSATRALALPGVRPEDAAQVVLVSERDPASPRQEEARPAVAPATAARGAEPAGEPARPAASAAVSDKGLHGRALEYVTRVLGEVLKSDGAKIRPDATLERYGIDSLISQEINARFERDLGPLPATMLFEHNTAERLSAYLLAEHRGALARVLGLTSGEAAAAHEGAADQGRGARADATPPEPRGGGGQYARDSAAPSGDVRRRIAQLSDQQVESLLNSLIHTNPTLNGGRSRW